MSLSPTSVASSAEEVNEYIPEVKKELEDEEANIGGISKQRNDKEEDNLTKNLVSTFSMANILGLAAHASKTMMERRSHLTCPIIHPDQSSNRTPSPMNLHHSQELQLNIPLEFAPKQPIFVLSNIQNIKIGEKSELLDTSIDH